MALTFKKIPSKDSIINRVQDALQDVLIPLIKSPLSEIVLHRSVALKANKDFILSHGLGRVYASWWVAAPHAYALIIESCSQNLAKDKLLILKSNADVICDVFVC